MGNDYFDSSSTLASQPLPTPSDTPYQAPFLTSSRRTSDGAGTSSYTAITPPPLPPDEYSFKTPVASDGAEKRRSRDFQSEVDARLVLQINDLRQRLAVKNDYIDELEVTLQDERSHGEALREKLRRKGRDHETAKTQLQAIEEQTMQALEDMRRERDVAQSTAADLRKKHENVQRQFRDEKVFTDQLQKDREGERAKWSQEKARLQRQNDITEGQLAATIREFTALLQAQDAGTTLRDEDKENVAPLAGGISSLHSSPTKPRKHRRNQSSLSTLNSIRQSHDLNDKSLADELNFDSGSEIISDEELSDREARVRKARASRRSELTDAKARKVLGIVSGPLERNANETTPGEALRKLEASASKVESPSRSGEVESATQRLMQAVSRRGEDHTTMDEPEIIEANQRRKRDPLSRSPCSHARASSEPMHRPRSSHEPSADIWPSTPGSPKSIKSFVTAVGANMYEPAERPEMTSSSTQTDPIEEPKSIVPPAPIPAPIDIPSIAIHPPDSGPSSPLDTVLPPHNRSVACQTEPEIVVGTTDAGVQTDIIRVDRRMHKLPPHLLPSALDVGTEAIARPVDQSIQTKDYALHKDQPQSTSPPYQSHFEVPERAASLDNANQDAAESSWSRLRKTFMPTNKQFRPLENDPFSGHEDTSMSEGDFASSQSSVRAGKRAQKYTRPSFDPPTPVPEDEKVPLSRPSAARAPMSGGSRGSLERGRMTSKSHSYSIAAKGRHGRRSSNGMPQRPGSPSSVGSSSAWSKSSGPAPPIMIPMRTSSAGLRKTRSSGQSSPTRRSGASSPTKRFDAIRAGKKPLLRKVKSAAIAPSDAPSSNQPLSPLSRASFASAELSPSPAMERISIEPSRAGMPGHQRQSSSQSKRWSQLNATGHPTAEVNRNHAVSQAMSEAMMGEWMWKCKGKDRSFGGKEVNSEGIKLGQARHKRWVWLQPHDNAISWASKPPSSTNVWVAGKSGRKHTILNVFDVPTDPHASKSSRNYFERSIHVKTPSRSLMFTATSKERHYMWLTALSCFVQSTSTRAFDLSMLPPPGPPGRQPQGSRGANEGTDIPGSFPTTGTASRSSRKGWGSRTRSRQSSGYVTPTIPEASASAEGSSLTMPPKPGRPAPTAPPEHYYPEAALAPSIPRIPGSRNGSSLSLHGRKRSASVTGVISTRTSSRANNSGSSSIRGVPLGFNSKTGSYSTLNSNPTSATSTSAPPVPSLPQSRADNHVATRHFGPGTPHASSTKEPSTPVLDELQAEGYGQEFTLGPDDMLYGEFGTNNSFFDAAGRRKWASRRSGQVFDQPPTREQMAAAGTQNRESQMSFSDTAPTTGTSDSFANAGSGLGGLTSHPSDEQRPSIEEESEGYDTMTEGQGHANNASVDSVAPPPIQRRVVMQEPQAPPQAVGGEKESAASGIGRRRWF